MSTIKPHPIFLKFGGSLITEKDKPGTPQPEMLAALCQQINRVRRENPQLRIVLGHGSGSFGHVPARKYRTREGVQTPEEWGGFIEVYRQAGRLHRLVMEALERADVPALSCPPSGAATVNHGQVLNWPVGPIQAALDAGLVPVVAGDVAFDQSLGGTILSTENVFSYLAAHLHPARILIAGVEAGVWADYPYCTRLIPEITPENFASAAPALGGSTATDVTGGMRSKVEEMLKLVEENPGMEVLIFGVDPIENLVLALKGENPGTLILAHPS